MPSFKTSPIAEKLTVKPEPVNDYRINSSGPYNNYQQQHQPITQNQRFDNSSL